MVTTIPRPHPRHTDEEHQLLHELIQRSESSDGDIVKLFKDKFPRTVLNEGCVQIHRGHNGKA